jgi:hypothetical protein
MTTWGRHTIKIRVGRPQLVEGRARWRGSKFPTIERKPLREDRELELTAMFKVAFEPEPRGIREQMLRELKGPFDVDRLDPSVLQFQLRERDVFAKPIPLRLVCRTVDGALEDECLFQL